MAKLNLLNISVLNQTWQVGSVFSYETESRPYCGICFIDFGEITYKTKTGDISAEAGDVVIIKSNIRYRAVFGEYATRDILINFNCGPLGDEKLFFSDADKDIIVLKKRRDLQKNFYDILRYDLKSGRECMVKAVLYGILDGICSVDENNAAFARIKQMVDEDSDFELKEPEMAKKCMVSVSTFQRIFKRAYGKTVSEYRNELRISKAKELLISQNHSVEEIADILGFCDSAYFSRCFKKTEGISPKKYLKQYYSM